jgi:hypothetical protein
MPVFLSACLTFKFDFSRISQEFRNCLGAWVHAPKIEVFGRKSQGEYQMLVRGSWSLVGFSASSILFALAFTGQSSAQDARQICSEKYQAAKAAGSLNGEAWPQFYSRCTIEIKAGAVATEAAAPTLDIRQICSKKYQAAKAAGALEGATWPQFYSRCTSETKANPPAAEPASPAPEAVAVAPPVVAAPEPPVAEPAPTPVVAAPEPPAAEPLAAPVVAAPPPPVHTPAPTVVATPAPAPAPAVNPLKPAPSAKPVAPAAPAAPTTAAVFPTAISPDFASEKPAKARLKTCSKQFQANKATNANGGLKWIQKGGGYWSECNKRLKG